MKKISALILFVLVITALPLGIVSAEDAPIKIGVLQLVEHAALDAA